MIKLEKEQRPKVIAIGVMATGLLGYAGYMWLGHGVAPTPAVASPAHPAAPPPPVVPTPPPNDPERALTPIDHENPFVPVFTDASATPAAPKPAAPAAKAAAKPAGKPAPTKPSLPPGSMMAALPDRFNGPAMDGDPGGAVPALAPVVPPAAPPPAPRAGTAATARPKSVPAAKPAPPAAPRPPALTVTGIIEGQENVAILKWQDGKGQVVRAGDHLGGGYTVKAIRADAVVLSLGTREWVARLGAATN